MRDRIIELLRCGPLTADEIAAQVQLTTNAVRQHLATLERDGYVVRQGSRHAPSVGKPPIVFAIAPDIESTFSRAYAPVLTALVAALPDHVAPDALDGLLADVASRLAASAPAPRGEFQRRVRAGADALTALGGLVETDGHTLRACSCVLAEAVAARPELCRAVEMFVSAVTGLDAHEQCDRGGSPRCRFMLTAPSAPDAA
ncbi:MAG TPA: ArsR family transcriptional regulator [Gemmatimonadaceae bacterium]|nr:ArsR family transcriptional regulator [Gemmatimonadaceae bacterium]